MIWSKCNIGQHFFGLLPWDYNLSRATLLDKTQILITGEGKINVYVVDGFYNDLILGIDALNMGDGKIDLPRRALFWFNQKWPLLGERASQFLGTIDRPLSCGNTEIYKLVKKFEHTFSSENSPLI